MKTETGRKKSKVNLPVIGGLRFTKQRQVVYDVLVETRDHPTANVVYSRVRAKMPTISLATVYNCLDALVEHGLVRQVNFDREPSRFCPNFVEHGHFCEENTGTIFDVQFKKGVNLHDFLDLPEGACVSAIEFSLRGSIQSAASGKKSSTIN